MIPVAVKVSILEWIIYKTHIRTGLTEDFSIRSEKKLGLFSPDRVDMR